MITGSICGKVALFELLLTETCLAVGCTKGIFHPADLSHQLRLVVVNEWQPQACKPTLLLAHLDETTKPLPLIWEHIPFEQTPTMTPSASLSILTNLVTSISHQSLSAIGRRPSRDKLNEEVDLSTLSLQSNPPDPDTSPEPTESTPPQKSKHKFGFGKLKKVIKKMSSRDANLNKQSLDNVSSTTSITKSTPVPLPDKDQRSPSPLDEVLDEINNMNKTPSPAVVVERKPSVLAPLMPEPPPATVEDTVAVPLSYLVFVSTAHITIYDRLSKERIAKTKFEVDAIKARLIGKRRLQYKLIAIADYSRRWSPDTLRKLEYAYLRASFARHSVKMRTSARAS